MEAFLARNVAFYFGNLDLDLFEKICWDEMYMGCG
jgi:hypothetical protein